MRRLFTIIITLFNAFQLSAQKTDVAVVRFDKSYLSFWQVLDERQTVVYSSEDKLTADSLVFSLESDRQFSLRIIFPETSVPDTISYRLYIGDNPVLYIKEATGSKERSYPFHTGIRSATTKITGGSTASIADYPWQVYYRAGAYRCGATIIAPGWILTAAHCTEDDYGNKIPASDMFIIAGSDNPASGTTGKKYYVSQVIVHEGFNNTTLVNDVAVLKLSENINYPNATPIKLVSTVDVADGAISPGVMSTVTGWGLTRVSPDVFPTTLQKVQLPIVSNAQASTVWRSIPSTDIMAGYADAGKDACGGDSGGPLVVPVTGEFKIAGIVSWGSSSCNTYGGYTSVSAVESWIRLKTGLSDLRPSVPAGETMICNPSSPSVYSVAVYPSATAYEWKIYPDNAGIASGSATTGSVTWNSSFTGPLYVMVRAMVNGTMTDWSKLEARIAPDLKLTRQAGDTTLCTGKPITLLTEAEGYNLSFNWYRDGTLIKTGSTGELNYPYPVTANSGVYKCIVNSSCGTMSTENAELNVLPLTAISNISPDEQITLGEDVTLTVDAIGHEVSYQWRKNTATIENETFPELMLRNVDTRDIANYQVTVKGTCGTITSDSIYLFVERKEKTAPAEIMIWPTITSSEINIAVKDDQSYSVRLFSTTGTLLKLLKNCHYTVTLGVADLPKEVYIVEISAKEFRKSIRIIKK